ncbi:2-oxoacid:acceptor oxidoreductase family protein [Desulfosporosinus sp. SB140]|uniref:2-oxoacid:acceptor oxidoreductase family protein n=1 Tax=Desulfosporosinus paludis TaxID=3115649 RepID=UPI003890530A
MVEIKFQGRYGQSVGKVTRTIGKQLMAEGKHVQVFDSFGANRPGAPMNSTVRVSNSAIIERSADNTTPDVVVVLDNSLFKVTDVTSGLKTNGVVMALGVDAVVLGEKVAKVRFIKLDGFVQGGVDPEQYLLKALKENAICRL